MGHRGAVSDGLWAYNNPQAEIDFAYRATHAATVAGKAIAEHFYSSAAEKSYFMGCSVGGRQGFVEAQLFPWDFDGIIAGAPALSLTKALMNALWNNRSIVDESGQSVLDRSDIDVLHKSVMAQCDSDDGLKDGLLEDPRTCAPDLSRLLCGGTKTRGCLSARQINAVERVYGGPITSNGEHINSPSAMPGSELSWIDMFSTQARLYSLARDKFRYATFQPDPGPAWQPHSFDFDRDYKRFGMTDGIYEAVNPDLRKFRAAGGKIIAYHGWSDVVIPALATVDYYETVERTMGRESTADFFRLFMLPGVAHCGGDVGAYSLDLLGYLEAWVERGRAPDMILSAHSIDSKASFGDTYPYREFPKDGAAKFTRPVYPYPQRTKYRGSGNPKDAANYQPVER